MSYRSAERKPVGPFEVLAMLGRYCVLDRGDGSRIIASTFNTREAAERWIARRQEERVDA